MKKPIYKKKKKKLKERENSGIQKVDESFSLFLNLFNILTYNYKGGSKIIKRNRENFP